MNSYVSRSKLFSAIALPAGIFVGSLAELILKYVNPNNVDISARLAYLRPVMILGVGTVVGFLLASLACVVMARKKGEDVKAAKNALILLAVVAGLCFGSIIAQNRIEAKEKSYSNQKVKDFFQQLQNRNQD